MSAIRENPPLFATTRWSVVLAARDGDTGGAAVAMEHLCRCYWPALYAYARRQGLSPHDAEDAAQAFFARLLEKDYLHAVQRDAGPFRAFLQMAFRRFLAKEREHAGAARRGGATARVPWDLSGAENFYIQDPEGLPAEEAFERRWAMTVLAAAMDALHAEFETAGRAAEFEVLKPALGGTKEAVPHAEIAAALGCSEGAARVAIHRVRKRFRELFRAEVAHTVAAHEAVEEELRHLVGVLARA